MEFIEKLAREHGTGGWQTLDDMVRFGKAVAAAEREACKQAVRDEPELEDEMPHEMFEYMTRGRAEMTEAMRGVVRATKQEILARIDLRSNAVVNG